MHSFSIFSQRLLTEMDDQTQCFPSFSSWMKHTNNYPYPEELAHMERLQATEN